MATYKDVTCFVVRNMLAIVEIVPESEKSPAWLRHGLDRYKITLGYFQPINHYVNETDADTLFSLLEEVANHREGQSEEPITEED